MMRQLRGFKALAAAGLGGLILTSALHAKTGTDNAGQAPQPAALESTRHVVAAGGGDSRGGAFAVRGSIGQADAEPLQPSTGGAFAIIGGFWAGPATSAVLPREIFRDGFESAPSDLTGG
jgi:hypothetical protein